MHGRAAHAVLSNDVAPPAPVAHIWLRLFHEQCTYAGAREVALSVIETGVVGGNGSVSEKRSPKILLRRKVVALGWTSLRFDICNLRFNASVRN